MNSNPKFTKKTGIILTFGTYSKRVMQKNRLLSASLLLVLIAAGCNTEISLGEKKGPELVFTTDSEFKDGEQVGIFIEKPMLFRNIKATYNAGKLQTDSKFYWPKDMPADSAITLRSASPYSTDFNPAGAVPFSVQPDQSGDGDFRASDLRLAKITATPADKEIKFDFEHSLSKICIYLQSESKIEEVTLSGLKPSVFLNFESELFRPAGDALEIKGHLSASNEDGVCAYEFVVIPQTATLSLKIKTADAECSAVTVSAIELGRGLQYTNERLISISSSRRSPYQLNLLEGEWVEPEFIFEEPLPDGIELTDATLPGIYTCSQGIATEFIVGGTDQWQTAVCSASSALSFKMMNPSAGKACILTLSSESISEGMQYDFTLLICEGEGVITISSKLKVVKKVGKTAWLLDEINSLGFVINTNR